MFCSVKICGEGVCVCVRVCVNDATHLFVLLQVVASQEIQDLFKRPQLDGLFAWPLHLRPCVVGLCKGGLVRREE